MMTKCKLLKNILLRDKMMMSRLGLAVGSLLWAVQLLLSTDIFVTPQEALAGYGKQTYKLMTLLAPEWGWGVMFFTHSCFSFYTLFSGHRSKITVVGDGFLGSVLWTTSTLACYVSNWPVGMPFFQALQAYQPPAAMSGSVVIAMYAWWHLIRFWAEEENHKLPCSKNT